MGELAREVPLADDLGVDVDPGISGQGEGVDEVGEALLFDEAPHRDDAQRARGGLGVSVGKAGQFEGVALQDEARARAL